MREEGQGGRSGLHWEEVVHSIKHCVCGGGGIRSAVVRSADRNNLKQQHLHGKGEFHEEREMVGVFEKEGRRALNWMHGCDAWMVVE